MHGAGEKGLSRFLSEAVLYECAHPPPLPFPGLTRLSVMIRYTIARVSPFPVIGHDEVSRPCLPVPSLCMCLVANVLIMFDDKHAVKTQNTCPT